MEFNTTDTRKLFSLCDENNMSNLKRLLCILNSLPFDIPKIEEKVEEKVRVINKDAVFCVNHSNVISFSTFFEKNYCRDCYNNKILEFQSTLPPRVQKLMFGKSPQKNSVLFRIRILSSWCSPREIFKTYSSKFGKVWDNVEMVEDKEDYTIVLNSTNEKIEPKKTIVFHMETCNIDKNFTKESIIKYLRLYDHETSYNNLEWHLSLSHDELITFSINKEKKLEKCVSSILSAKYHDIGQVRRIDFVKFLESKNFPIHVFGTNAFFYKDYKGKLPIYEKDKGLFPYTYTFAVENKEKINYITEKLIDGILSECLVFYCGAPNVKEIIDERAYVRLDLINFEKDYEKMKSCIENDEWIKRLPYIKREKTRILNELCFFPRVCRIINEIEK